MINASTLLDAYLDVNVLLLLVCVLWFVFSRVLDRLGLAHAVTARLRMLRSVFIAVLMAPAFAALIVMAGQVGFAAPAQTVNLTDFIVAQYLQGRFAMNPSALEELLLLRSRLAEAAFTPAGRAILGLIAVGGVACFLRLGWSVVRLCRIIAESHHWRRFGRVELRVSDTISVPFSTRGCAVASSCCPRPCWNARPTSGSRSRTNCSTCGRAMSSGNSRSA